MNPLRIAEQLRTGCLQLLKTTFAPRQERPKQDFRTAVEGEGVLTREPFVSLALPYREAAALTEPQPETRERFGAIAKTPYARQGEAVWCIPAGLAAVVATGTGPGKSEVFLMPIADHCLRVAAPDILKVLLISLASG
jgi:DEAD/DEAH box helicase domain-containing protein